MKIDPVDRVAEASNGASDAFWGALVVWGDLPVKVVDTLLAPGVIIAVGLLAWWVQIRVLKRRAAFDYINAHLLRPDWLGTQQSAIVELKKRPTEEHWDSIARRWAATKPTEGDVVVLGAVFPFLNHLEFAAIGLRFRTGAIDRRVYADAWGITFIQAWERAKPFIDAMHKTDRGRELLRNFEAVATSRRFRKIARWREEYSVHNLEGS